MDDVDNTEHNDHKVKDALKRDWEQTKSDIPGLHGEDLDQGVGDTVKQATGKEAIPPEGVANPD